MNLNIPTRNFSFVIRLSIEHQQVLVKHLVLILSIVLLSHNLRLHCSSCTASIINGFVSSSTSVCIYMYKIVLTFYREA